MTSVVIGSGWRATVPRAAPFTGVLMCPPEHFAVIDVKNVFMEGQLGAVDRARASAQWRGLADAYRALGVAVHVLPAEPGREDMVFTANGACVLPREHGGADVVLSRMRHGSRAAEVPHLGRWLERAGFSPRVLPAGTGHLEGHGDVLAVPGRRLLLGGHGGRSEAAALAALAGVLGAPVVPLPLRGEVFYHLDTCLAVLDEDSVLLHPPAFVPEALATLAELFPRRIEAEPGEAREQLACNAHALPSGHVLLPAGAPRTAERLRRHGYEPVPVDVSEFHKSGGSVFCLRLALPDLPSPASAELSGGRAGG